jgi:hypothetical protein
VFENRMLRGIFGPKRDEVIGGWRKLHNEELHNLCIIRMTKSRKMRWAGHEARMGEKMNPYRILMGFVIINIWYISLVSSILIFSKNPGGGGLIRSFPVCQRPCRIGSYWWGDNKLMWLSEKSNIAYVNYILVGKV